MYFRGVTILLICQSAIAANLYVSPAGTAGGAGTIGDPLSLEKAIGATSPATSGDTIWLRGGTYSNTFNCVLSGTSNSPIIVRNYNRERAIIDSHAQFGIDGSGTWFWGLEFTDTYTNRYTGRTSGIGLNTGATGSDNKVINCIIHDCGNALFASFQSTNAEVTGCLIYNTGYSNTSNSGHSLYVQNRSYDHQSLYRENICFNSFGVGVNVHSSGLNVNTRVSGNVIFNAGYLSGTGARGNFYTECYPADQIIFDNNLAYYTTEEQGGHFYGYESTNGTIIVSNNVFAKNYSYIINWTNVVFNSNTQYVKIDIRPGETNYTTADYNSYYKVGSSTPVVHNQVALTLADWQSDYGNDIHGTATANDASGSWIFVRANPYETGRANIVVYNWDSADNVSVDVSGVLTSGQRFEVRNAEDYFATPVLSGTYTSGNISLPMTNLTVSVPVGVTPTPSSSAPEFATFVMLPLPSLSTATTVNAGTLILR